MNLINKSLLISVSDYMPDANGNNIDLNGPNNDSKDVLMAIISSKEEKKDKKKLFRFIKKLFKKRTRDDSRDHVRITDSNATKDNCLTELVRFIRSVGSTELGLFYFSGHGTQIPDTTGKEYDGLTECLCPYDTLAGQLITDDEIRFVINTNLKKGAKILMVIDCCHSGGQARSLSLEKTRGISIDTGAVKTFSYDEQLPEGVLLWAACADGEVAWERVYGGKPRGAFTHTILEYIQDLAAGIRIDFAKAHTEVAKKLYDPEVPNDRGSQMPHMESKNPIDNFWQ